MIDTLIESNGVGLAAPQVGVLRRVVLVDVGEEEFLELINPEIMDARIGRKIEKRGRLHHIPVHKGHSSDFTCHVMVLMIEMGISLDGILRELASRHVIDKKVKQEKMVS